MPVRSGPPPDPNSRTSRTQKGAPVQLPPEGYSGPVPRFPLPSPMKREQDVWRWAWRQPQAAQWAKEGEWRSDMVAEWVRMKVRAEDPTSPASILAQATAMRHQVGLTPAGLRENGWIIGAPRATQAEIERKQRDRGPSSRDRLKAADEPAA